MEIFEEKHFLIAPLIANFKPPLTYYVKTPLDV